MNESSESVVRTHVPIMVDGLPVLIPIADADQIMRKIAAAVWPDDPWPPLDDAFAAGYEAGKLHREPDDEQVTVTETFGWRRDDFDPHRSPGWDGVNAPGMGSATREWAEARAEYSRLTGTSAHVVRRETRVTQWRRDDGR